MDVEELRDGTTPGALLFRHSTDALSVLRATSAGDLEVVLANDAVLVETGWTPDELHGRLVSDLVGVELLDVYRARLAELSGAGDVVRFEVAAEVPAGRRAFDVMVVAMSPVDGDPHYLHVARDVTVAHRDRQALEETQALARIGHWTWDLSTDELHCTDQVTEIYGLPPSDGPQDVEIFWGQVLPEDEPPLREVIGAAIEAGGSFEAEYRVLGWTDQPRLVSTRGRCVLGSDGAVLRIAGTVQDVTEQRATERATRDAEVRVAREAHAFELNDDVVQGLAAARLALMAGATDEAVRLLDRTTDAARGLVGELLSATSGHAIGPGSLVRGRSAATPDGRAS